MPYVLKILILIYLPFTWLFYSVCFFPDFKTSGFFTGLVSLTFITTNLSHANSSSYMGITPHIWTPNLVLLHFVFLMKTTCKTIHLKSYFKVAFVLAFQWIEPLYAYSFLVFPCLSISAMRALSFTRIVSTTIVLILATLPFPLILVIFYLIL